MSDLRKKSIEYRTLSLMSLEKNSNKGERQEISDLRKKSIEYRTLSLMSLEKNSNNGEKAGNVSMEKKSIEYRTFIDVVGEELQQRRKGRKCQYGKEIH